MIISHLRKFIFVAIPKTGTHSVRRALRPHLGPNDMEQVGLFEQRALPIPELARVGHGHISLTQLRPFMKPEDFDSFFKFAFVRNPFDRFISYCAFLTRGDGSFERDPRAIMRQIVARPPQRHILFEPQASFIADPEGKPIADFVGRVETMQESYDEACRQIGIPTASLQRTNASRRKDYRDYYDAELVEGVAKLYARDLELFGYEF